MIRLSKLMPQRVLKENAELYHTLLSVLVIVGAVGVRMALKPFLSAVFSTVADLAEKIKDIVAPEKWMRFMKQLNKNDEFNREFVEYLKFKGGMTRAKETSSVVDVVMTRHTFRSAFDKFVRDEKISTRNAGILKMRLRNALTNAINNHSDEIVQRLRSQYPELTKDLKDSVSPKRIL
jgi:hypothetical protein